MSTDESSDDDTGPALPPPPSSAAASSKRPRASDTTTTATSTMHSITNTTNTTTKSVATSASNHQNGIAPPSKKTRHHNHRINPLLAARLPTADMYETSYMHRAQVTHVVATSKTDFVVTASAEGFVKFWKKVPEGIEFIKGYHAHQKEVVGLSLSPDGRRLCSVGLDSTLKFYDVLNFDMTRVIDLDFIPSTCVWISRSGDAEHTVAVADKNTGSIHVWSTNDWSTSAPCLTVRVHRKTPVIAICPNLKNGHVVSVDARGIIEYWSILDRSGKFPYKSVKFTSKMETDLLSLARSKVVPLCMATSPDGHYFSIACNDGATRVFHYRTGKIRRVLSAAVAETPDDGNDGNDGSDSNESGNASAHAKRRAMEEEVSSRLDLQTQSLLYDDSGDFLLRTTLNGIDIIHVASTKIIKTLGEFEETERFVNIALYQGVPKVSSQRAASKNKGKTIDRSAPELDPTIIATSIGNSGKCRFFLFTKREPAEDGKRDVFNEKPTSSTLLSAEHSSSGASSSTDATNTAASADKVTIHTTMGDITVDLYRTECPRTVENFCTHSKNEYYNNVIFHRVIKNFMLQTGDPRGNGTGGESIWGGTFDNEIHPLLKHEAPGILSMANAGPGTNGSQFFITTVPCEWLDGKHTVFGKVKEGMDVVRAIENVATTGDDKPLDDVRIVSMTVGR